MIQEFTLLFIISLVTSAVIILILLRSPLSGCFADMPGPRKIHQKIVPRLGGLGLVISFLLLQVFYRYGAFPQLPQLPTALFATFVFLSAFLLLGGTLDDVKHVSWRMKFLLQFLLAAVVVGVFDIRFESIHILYATIPLGAFSYLLSILWLVGVMNALNIIDGVDGLAACVSIIGFCTLAVLFNAHNSPDLVAVCVILAGITGGFFIHNVKSKNKTFLGDTGSLFLGSLLGLLCIQVTRLPKSEFSIFVPLLIVGYPIFDTTVAMIRRYTRNITRTRDRMSRRFLRMFEADNEHLHHRLVHWGLSHLQATLLLSLVAATMGSVAIIMSRLQPPLRIVVLSYLILAMVLILNRLRYLGVRHWLTFPRIHSPRFRLVGVIEPDDVFFYSLKAYDQNKVEFLSMPLAMTHKFRNQFSAIIVHNAEKESFKDDWSIALRAAEVHDCPVFMIAEQDLLKSAENKGRQYDSIILVTKPVRIPDLIDEIMDKTSKQTDYALHEPAMEGLPERKQVNA